jgi:hypothetical protein
MFTGGNTAQDESAANYDIYNETINCSTSEADGTFSITYNATIKKNDPSLNPVENAVLHTYTKNISTTMEGSKNVSISVQGNIQGLVRGGFIYYNNEFSLPSNGTFISTIDATETKYSNALAYFQAKVGDGSDLLPNFKTQLDITQSQLLVNTSCGEEEEESSPTPASFTVDHGYGTGSVGYNVSYDTATTAFSGQKKGYSNVTIVRNDPVDMIQEFIIPGRIEGPIIQKLGMRTARTISINIDGASPENKECVGFGDGANCFDPCDNLPKFSIKNFEKLLETNDKWIKTKEDYTSNKLDGSYSISLEYTCKG